MYRGPTGVDLAGRKKALLKNPGCYSNHFVSSYAIACVIFFRFSSSKLNELGAGVLATSVKQITLEKVPLCEPRRLTINLDQGRMYV